LFVRFVLRLLASFLVGALFEHSVCKYMLSFLFLSTRLGHLLYICPAFNNWAFLVVFIFSRTRLLALCPTTLRWRYHRPSSYVTV
jgi:hypothetical protein